jgi:predicted ester cyclase
LTIQSNIDLLRRAWAAYDSGDEQGFAACLTEDWVEYDAAGIASSNLDDELQAMRLHTVGFPDKHTEIHRVIADETSVACHCTVTATHTGRYFDAPPTGKRVVLHEMMFNRVRDGRLCETWGIVDGPGFYQQITGRPPPEKPDNMA